MKFADVIKGAKAEKATSFVYGGKTIPTLLRPLTLAEEVAILGQAAKSAEKSGSRKPEPGDSIFEAHLQAETVARTCLDPDSPEGARATTFASPDEVLEMDNDSVRVLFEQQSMWQQECSPSVHTTSTKELFKLAEEVNERGDPFDYVSLSQSTRWVLQRFTVLLLCNSPGYRSFVSLLSADSQSSPKELLEKAIAAMKAATPTPTSESPPAKPEGG